MMTTAEVQRTVPGGLQILTSAYDSDRDVLVHVVWIIPKGEGDGVLLIDLTTTQTTDAGTYPVRLRRWGNPSKFPSAMQVDMGDRVADVDIYLEMNELQVEVEVFDKGMPKLEGSSRWT